MGQPIDIQGQIFGRLTAMRKTTQRSGTGSVLWEFSCSCGNLHLAAVADVRRASNPTHSCGCIRGDYRKSGNARRTHGKSKSSIYSIWLNMIDRCENTVNPAYKNYGGRGIKVCERWLSFENFLADMGERPDGMSLERTDNDKGYEPGNVIWATAKHQANNRRSNRVVSYGEIEMTLSEWGDFSGVPDKTIRKRLERGIPMPFAAINMKLPAGFARIANP